MESAGKIWIRLGFRTSPVLTLRYPLDDYKHVTKSNSSLHLECKGLNLRQQRTAVKSIEQGGLCISDLLVAAEGAMRIEGRDFAT
jgi:hypothetical protein